MCIIVYNLCLYIRWTNESERDLESSLTRSKNWDRKNHRSQGMALTPAGFSSSQSDKAKYPVCQKRQR